MTVGKRRVSEAVHIERGEENDLMAKQDPKQRFRFDVPSQDTSVLEWMKAQAHPSMSLRMLIKEDAARNGFTDVTCRSVDPAPKRGRPSESVKQAAAYSAVPVSVSEPPVRQAAAKGAQNAVPAVQKEPKAEFSPQIPAAPVCSGDDEGAVSSHSEESAPAVSIEDLFSGGAVSSKQRPMSAAAMGLLSDDE